MILIDGVRYNLHKFKDEKEFENVIEEHARDIFGERSVYFGKKMISSLSGISSIPDGYAITFEDGAQWYVVEVELSSHPIFDHIVPQINKFINGLKSDATKRELINYMDKEIRSQSLTQNTIKERFGEVYKFLSDLIYKQPTILIIIDERTKVLDDVVSSIPLKTDILEFKTFEREGVGIAVHAHLFEPIHKPIPKKTLEIEIKTESYIKHAMFYIPKKDRHFFPGYKVPFILETDLGEIKTKVTDAPKGTPIGNSGHGNKIIMGLREWFQRHPELDVGKKVRFECIEPYKRYRLQIV